MGTLEFNANRKSVLPTAVAIIGVILIFTLGCYLRFKSAIKWPGYDASEYHYVAKNLSAGRGLEVNVVSQFYPRPPSVEHQLIPFHMPLNYYLLAASYRIFGASYGARAIAVLMDLALAIFIFFIAKKISSGDVLVGFFSAAIFSLHPASLNARFSGGSAAGFAMFFGFLFVWFSYRATEEPVNFIPAGLMGACSYLIRNEGIFTLPSLLAVWFFVRKKDRKSLYYFIAGIGIIVLAFAVWEIRNYSIYGSSAATSRYNMMFGRDYYDMWRYYPDPSDGIAGFIREYLKVGLPRIIITKIQSYHYKILWAMDAVGFPLALFIIGGLTSRVFDKKFLAVPVVYFILSYLFFGFFNAHSQQWGWYAAEVFVPLWSIVAVVGCFQLPINKPSLRRIFGIMLASTLVLFYLSDVAKMYFKNKKISVDPVAELSGYINDFRLKHNKSAVFMTHIPYIFAYFYPDIKMVQIPTNEPLEAIEEVIKKYNCDYLLLYGVIPSAYPFVFKDMYEKGKELKGFREVFSRPNPSGLNLEGAGMWLKIYKIEKDKLHPGRSQ